MMSVKPADHAVTVGAQLAVGLIILVFVVGAMLLVIFGLVPTHHGPTTGETTYRVIGDTFTMDRTMVDLFSVTMETARMLSHLLVATLCLLVAAFFLQLFLILGSARRGDPFSQDNAARLSRMGWIALLVIVAKLMRLVAAGEALSSGPVLQTIAFLAVGLSFLVIGHVFQIGTQMRDDLEGTI